MSTERATLQRDTWFTADMSPAIVSQLAEMGEIRDFPANAALISAGAPCPALGLLLDGCVALRIRVPGDPARTILTLHDIEGYRHEEIATLTGVTVGTSKAQLFRARRLLREALDR